MKFTNTTDLEDLRERVYSALDGLGLHPFYLVKKVSDVPAPPYAYFRFEREHLIGSDEKTRKRTVNLVIFLVTPEKRFDLEDAIEAEFDEFECDKSEDYIQGDEVYEETFVFEITQKIKRKRRTT